MEVTAIFKDNVPIYIQICNDIKEQIIRGTLKDGDKLPSIREYSVIYEVTNLTIQRAMQQLEQDGIIQARKGVGSFIIDGSKDLLGKNMIGTLTKEFITKMKNMGLTNAYILKILEEELEHERFLTNSKFK
ncbi:GntR family transcriptional regulator [Clostridium sp.]|uniref:GntR family transcriptional regulator n=1 Tax=Clostridium sp. TaxID=1506 RepID=UPI0028479B52|nr:GntR family transcriptional regulator [Clostridium sp.]MDR3593553.1 GntR family transcriptional regulator [Clostridium sp.]